MTTTRAVYFGSSSAATRKYLRDLAQRSPHGWLAAELFRAQKASSRAKVYRTSRHAPVSYRDAAYRRKEDAIATLCVALAKSDLAWGWGDDQANTIAPYVLYVELPDVGQVSFHAPTRGPGPEFHPGWDGVRGSEERAIRFCEIVAGERSPGASTRELPPTQAPP